MLEQQQQQQQQISPYTALNFCSAAATATNHAATPYKKL
jgi:hypothetical protein